METKGIHGWMSSIMLTLVCWLVVYNFVIQMPLWEFVLIEIILAFGDKFHIFVMSRNHLNLPNNINEDPHSS